MRVLKKQRPVRFERVGGELGMRAEHAYTCPECGEGFFGRYGAKQHAKNAHHGTVSIDAFKRG